MKLFYVIPVFNDESSLLELIKKIKTLNSSYDNYYNIIHILPKVLISTLGLVSAVFCMRKKGFYQFMFYQI